MSSVGTRSGLGSGAAWPGRSRCGALASTVNAVIDNDPIGVAINENVGVRSRSRG